MVVAVMRRREVKFQLNFMFTSRLINRLELVRKKRFPNAIGTFHERLIDEVMQHSMSLSDVNNIVKPQRMLPLESHVRN